MCMCLANYLTGTRKLEIMSVIITYRRKALYITYYTSRRDLIVQNKNKMCGNEGDKEERTSFLHLKKNRRYI